MRKVDTSDGSCTYRCEIYDETYHSTTGAKEESFEKFVRPCNIQELSKQNVVKVLDVCFGLGYNTSAMIDELKSYNKDIKIEIYALENDWNILKKILEVDSAFDSYKIIKEMIEKNVENDEIIFEQENVKINLLVGDARKKILEISEFNFDVCFLDPFSPKKCPELWTEDFFSEIFVRMKENAILTTYSCARIVRDNLKKVGFNVFDGPCVGRKSPSTIAVK